MNHTNPHRVAVIGAGPVGLAAAAHLLARGLEPIVFEAGDRVGASVREWGHVRVFSPWEFNLDPAAVELLERHGWESPPLDGYPTGSRDRRALPRAAGGDARDRRGAASVRSRDRRDQGRLRQAQGHRPRRGAVRAGRRRARGRARYLASAVIDASGTWTRPNPLGAGGLLGAGERALADRIAYGIPDVLGDDRSRYAGKRVVVVGSGHSAFNAILDLVALRESAPATQIVWAIRGGAPGRKYGGGGDDQLPARGALGSAVRELVADGSVALAAGFQTRAVWTAGEKLVLADGTRELVADEVIAATGFRPDLRLLGELRLDLDDRVEAARALAPLIDPNLHSCGSVPPHGVDELSHPDAGVYMVGMKSYGRAPTFLLRTGYEQVRSVVAALAGDWDAARRVELVLPETGVCSAKPAPGEAAAPAACCGSGSQQRAGRRRIAVTAAAVESHPRPAWRTRAWGIVGALSVTETVSWGILYYAFAVFLVPMQRDLGYSAAQLTGALSLALGVSASPASRSAACSTAAVRERS